MELEEEAMKELAEWLFGETVVQTASRCYAMSFFAFRNTCVMGERKRRRQGGWWLPMRVFT